MEGPPDYSFGVRFSSIRTQMFHFSDIHFANSRKRCDFFPIRVIPSPCANHRLIVNFLYFSITYLSMPVFLAKRHELCLKPFSGSNV
jgi:hypothetical protein